MTGSIVPGPDGLKIGLFIGWIINRLVLQGRIVWGGVVQGADGAYHLKRRFPAHLMC